MNLKNKIIAVVFGGPSGEHEVSCKSAKTIVEALQNNEYKVFPIGVSKKGRWYGPVSLEDIVAFDEKKYENYEMILPHVPEAKPFYLKDINQKLEIDVYFPIIHGSYGEDGHLQALFEMCHLPYVGTGAAGSVVGMDKVYMRDILKAHAIPQTDYCAVRRYDVEHQLNHVLDRLEQELPYPMFVKPARMGSSVGISKVQNRDELAKGLVIAGRYDGKLIVERGVHAREIEIAVMGNFNADAAEPGEIISSGTFYDYDAKYVSNESKTLVPTSLEEKQKDAILQMAKDVFEILDLRGFSRVDFFIDRDTNEILLNEVNTLPGFTTISMFPMMWQASGVTLIEIIERLLILAFEEKQELDKNYTILEER